MSFSSAKVRLLREESLRRGAIQAPAPLSSVGLDLSGGEGDGGSVGGGDFLTPGGSVASRVDSAEERFKEDEEMSAAKRKLGKEGAVKLVFPLRIEESGLNDPWPWNVCGGLIGGPRGNRFCTKMIKGSKGTHCGVGSHATYKAEIHDGHGYIPSVLDRSNTESAFLEPCVDAARFPDSINDLMGRELSHDEWISFLTVLPPEEVMQESEIIGFELAAEAFAKSKHPVSFAVTPATKKPKLMHLVSRILNSKSAKNLETRFNDEDPSADKAELSFENLEAPASEEWNEDGDVGGNSFTPSASHWNALVRRVESVTSELKMTQEAVAVLAEVSEARLEMLDDQVIHLRGSVGARPLGSGSSLPALDLWTNVVKLADEVDDTRETLAQPKKPSGYDTLSRSLVESAKNAAKKNTMAITSLDSSKAEYVGQVKPLESVVDDVTQDLYSPEGAFNKLLMSGSSAGSGSLPQLQVQYKLLADEVKQLSGSNLGGHPVLDPNDPAITSLKADVAVLWADTQSIKANIGGEIVTIENQAYHSSDELESFIVKSSGSKVQEGIYEFFFDVTSMQEALQDANRNSDETMDNQALSRKANHRSVSAARMLNSFGVSVPQIMNKKNSPEPFSLVPSYSKWKSNDGRSGLVESIRKSLQLWETRTTSTLASRFSSPETRELLVLCRGLIRKSMTFWSSLCNWIDEFYGKLTSKTESQKPGGDASLTERKEYDVTLASVREESWRLVINVLTDIFQELALRRADGQAASDASHSNEKQSAIVLYSCLKAHKFMDELIERRFERHPVMAPTFNGFLFSERASHGDIKRLELKLAECSNLTRNLQSKVDKK